MTRLVGITAHQLAATDDGVSVPHFVASHAYVKAVAKTGAEPVLLPIVDPNDRNRLHRLLDRLDAVVITGGPDVDPANYGREREPGCGPSSVDRDEADLAIARACVERDVPTLAICRGIQVLNVALGGTLVQHLDHHMVMEHYNEAVHDVEIVPGSSLATILGVERYWSNSLHHQCIDTVGDRARVTARAPDGTIEAIEVDGAPHVVGVQWHPELLRYDATQQRLFRHLLGA